MKNPHFESTWLTKAQLGLWLIRRNPKNRWELPNAIAEIRHAMHQKHQDLKRRGKSNREGSNNRRWRKYKSTAPKVIFSCPAFDLVA